MLINLSRTLTASKLVEEIKKGSLKWIKTKGSQFLQFAWQNGYGIFSVSSSHKDAVILYIANQRKHHREVSFQEEYRRLLNKNGVEFNERYVWD
ncbi:MAG: putative transposase [Chlamydiales bacterium]|jgi:putative transposase